MTILVLLSMFPNGHWDVLEPFVTMEDKIAFLVLVVFVTYHITRLVFSCFTHLIAFWNNLSCNLSCNHRLTVKILSNKQAHVRAPNTVNAIMGILSLVALCYYTTMDNPYVIVITLIFSSRLVQGRP